MSAQKKSRIAQERDEERRGLFKWLASRFDARRLVSVDESGFQITMTRLRSRAPRGKLAYGTVPRNRGRNQTLIASMTLEGGMGACMCVAGGTDAPVLEACVEKAPAPSLVAGQVVVLDNPGARQPERVRELIEGRGCELVCLPSCSPDLTPMEEAFSKIKNIVRKAEERTREGLNRAIAGALWAVTLHDVAGWFAHCGCYESQGQYS